MNLPKHIQRLFYRYHADLIDTEKHMEMIILTVLADGSFEDWEWLFDVYRWDAIREWIAKPQNAWELPPPLERFWTLVLLGTPHETPLWAGGNSRRLVPVEALPEVL